MITKTCQALMAAEQPLVILPHISPDGDTVGSAVALYYALQSFGKEVYIVLDDKLPDDFAYIAEQIVLTSQQFANLGIVHKTSICVDLSDLERLGARRGLVDNSYLINIDHHRTNTMFGDIQCVDAGAAATAEVIFRLLSELKVRLTAPIAEALYIAMITDTGNFKYSSTTPNTLRIAADLLEIPFDRMRAINRIYHSVPRAKAALQAAAISNTQFFAEGKIAICAVSQADLRRFAALDEYSEGIVEAVRNIAGVEVAVFIKQQADGNTKVSMRSLSEPDVSLIAFAHGGGGHTNAAGFSLAMPFDKALHYCTTALLDEVRSCMAL